MYPKYFGLKEASFSITPDPQYLFLSKQHREALAHLLYGAGDSGGFVLLTGEVGTGKTTVCRAFLEQLPDGVDVALVLNPAMTAVELLHAICDEFRLEVPAGEQSAKSLVDRLNGFLLEAHSAGRRPVLIIDEAQNLRPKVLEQIRLLTNLETSKHKLLQIFLIGQPELRAMLASPDLRQLNQRITARFHLRPLSAAETAAYVDHRIAVAGVERPLFSAPALRRVHRYTGGVPRLINLLCDRALLGAAVSRRMQVTPAVVARAARELRGSDHGPLPRRNPGLAWALSVLLAALVGVWAGTAGLVDAIPRTMTAWTSVSPQPAPGAAGESVEAAEPTAPPVEPAGEAPDSDDVALAGGEGPPSPPDDPVGGAQMAAAPADDTGAEPAPPPSAVVDPVPEPGSDQVSDSMPDPMPDPMSDPMSDPASAPDPESGGEQVAGDDATALPRISMAGVLPTIGEPDPADLADLLVPKNGAVDALLRLWGIDTEALVSGLDCPAVAAFGLDCERGNGRWSDLRLFDRPVALSLTLPDGQRGQVIVAGIDEEHAVLADGDGAVRVPIPSLDERWSGEYLMLWRMPPSGARMISRRAPPAAIAWLRERLAELPGSTLPTEPARYDAALDKALRRFQSEQGLLVDGIAGPRTLILLSNVLDGADVPRLTQLQ